MSRYLIPLAIVVGLMGAPVTGVLAWKLVMPAAVIVQPGPAPVVVNTFADDVAAAWKANGGNSEDACLIVDAYTALQGLLTLDVNNRIADTEKLAKVAKLGNQLAFGKARPFEDKYKFLNAMFQAELIKRGITVDADGDGKPDVVPVNREAWLAFYGDVIKGLSQ